MKWYTRKLCWHGIKYNRNIEDISKKALRTIRRNYIIELKNLSRSFIENPMNTNDESPFNLKSNVKLFVDDIQSESVNIIL